MDQKETTPLALYFCGYEKCDPAHSFGPAIRPHYLIHFILSGEGTYYENGREHRLKQGDAFLILPGKTTFYIADTTDPWEYCWIGFDGKEVQNILEHCGLLSDQLVTHTEESDLSTCLMELLQLFENRVGNQYTYISYLYRIFSYMYRLVPSAFPEDTADYLKQATQYISNNYVYDIRISDIARYIGIDRTYLYKLFMERKNTSPQQYLIDFRLMAVCRLLKETNLTVTEIALSCGFKDAPSMNKHFKKRYHITPLLYRKSRA